MIREYRNDDAGAALELYMDCFQSPPFHYDWLRLDAIKRYFSDMVRTPGFRGFVFELNSVVSGICLGVLQDYFVCPTYEIKEFIVSRICRGRGVGKMFLADVEHELVKEGVGLISLSTADYLDAFEFYKKNGYMASRSTVWMGKVFD